MMAVVRARGTTNGNQRGGSESRRRRRAWLVENYRANMDSLIVTSGPAGPWRLPTPVGKPFPIEKMVLPEELPYVSIQPSCRCYRCGCLMTCEEVTVDRIIPGAKGGTYRRNNIRPACGPCNSETGGQLGNERKYGASKNGRTKP